MSGPTWEARVLSAEPIVVGQVCSSIDCTFEDWVAYTVEPTHAPGRRSVLLADHAVCPETGHRDQVYSMELERQYIPVVLDGTGNKLYAKPFSNTVITYCTPISS